MLISFKSGGQMLRQLSFNQHDLVVRFLVVIGCGLIALAISLIVNSASISTTTTTPLLISSTLNLLHFNAGIGIINSSTYSLQTTTRPPSLPPASSPPYTLNLKPKKHHRHHVRVGGAHVMREMDDQELLRRAANTDSSTSSHDPGVPKVAFMFLVKGPFHLSRLWERFFKRIDGGLYSIYVHFPPGYNPSFAAGSIFKGRSIPSKEVRWGHFDMVEAERRLIANALLNQQNQRFILLSDSCIPLHNFTTIYTYLINSTHAFVDSHDLPGLGGRDRYSPWMSPVVAPSQWRKGSQWFEIDRATAIAVVSDTKYFPMFHKFCKMSGCGDEHYLQTFVPIVFGKRNANRSLTWVDWSANALHPRVFKRGAVTPEMLGRIRSDRSCVYNGRKGGLCFLFARKFDVSSLKRLMFFAPRVLGIH